MVPGGSAAALKAVVEGAIKILIFFGYLMLVSLMPDMRRVFQYHGGEHKSIFCYEAKQELTVENAMKCRAVSSALRHLVYFSHPAGERDCCDVSPLGKPPGAHADQALLCAADHGGGI